jgi:hypothetical protein
MIRLRPVIPALRVLCLAGLGLLPVTRTAAQTPAIAATEWVRAGVTGGIPSARPVIATVAPGTDLQTVIDHAPETGGVILLQEGDHVLTATLRLRSGISLRGIDRVSSRLVIMLRAHKPARAYAEAPDDWTVGVLFQKISNAGLEHLTVIFDPSLPVPVAPTLGPDTYVDDADGRNNLHVISVAFLAARDCWLTQCFISNAGSHPLMISDSRHLTVRNVGITGTHNRGPGSGQANLYRSEHALFDQVTIRDINSCVIHTDRPETFCRYNVIADSSLEVDLRLHGTGTRDNLIERTAIAVPPWMERTPLSPGNAKAHEPPPGPGNLLFLCTVTRNFASGQRAFSMADNPNLIYQVLQRHAREREPSVEVYAPAPPQGSLRPGA